jgi:hypothetical protein
MSLASIRHVRNFGLTLLAAAVIPALSQSSDPAKPFEDGSRKHDGFYLSLNIGPAFGGTVLKATGSDAQSVVGGNELIYRGQGFIADFKIGGAIKENLILSFDLISRTITGPEVEVDGNTIGTASNDIVATDNTMGVGMTYYIMPHNIFLSGTVGMAKMTIENKDTDAKGESKAGLGLHVKVGKEWWVSKNWGLGLSGGYGFLIAEDKAPPAGVDYDGTLTSHQLYIMFNTTFN